MRHWRWGSAAPVCGQGTLYALPPGVEIRIDGHALLSAMPYDARKAAVLGLRPDFYGGGSRGRRGGQIQRPGPGRLAVSRYYLGLPGYRCKAIKRCWGCRSPMRRSGTRSSTWGTAPTGSLRQMEQVAAQGELIFHDDTAVRILSLIQENSDRLAAAQAQGYGHAPGPPRDAHYGAGGESGGAHGHSVLLSRRHAGENLQGLLDKRESGLDKPLAMSDALASNAVANDAAVIRCHCLAHGRRKFSDLVDVFPHECQVVLEVLSQVFDHEEHARQAQLSPEARLAYHQTHSRPLMDGLKRWLDRRSTTIWSNQTARWEKRLAICNTTGTP